MAAEALRVTVACQPLTFPIPHALEGLAAGIAAIAGWRARRATSWLITTGTVTEISGIPLAA
jgi:hypothetical protein